MKTRRMPDRRPGEEVTALRAKAVFPLRDKESPRDAVTRPAPIHSHTSGRARVHSRCAPTKPGPWWVLAETLG